MVLLALDPSVKCSGLALFHERRLVNTVTLKEPRGRTKWPKLRRCLWMAQEAANWVLAQGARPDDFVTEWPKIYAPGKGRGDPQGLPGLAGIGAALGAILVSTPALRPLHADMEAYSYLPKEWSQGLPKTTDRTWKQCPRYLRIASRMSERERPTWEAVKSHDAMDAVGIGLHHLGRLKRRRAFPGAS